MLFSPLPILRLQRLSATTLGFYYGRERKGLPTQMNKIVNILKRNNYCDAESTVYIYILQL